VKLSKFIAYSRLAARPADDMVRIA
jgi:hypothetical protein